MRLLRWQVFSMYGVGMASIWIAAMQALQSSSSSSSSSSVSWFVQLMVYGAPIWGLILLGLYGIGMVVYGVVALRDHPQEAVALEQEVQAAKKQLVQMGTIDS